MQTLFKKSTSLMELLTINNKPIFKSMICLASVALDSFMLGGSFMFLKAWTRSDLVSDENLDLRT